MHFLQKLREDYRIPEDNVSDSIPPVPVEDEDAKTEQWVKRIEILAQEANYNDFKNDPNTNPKQKINSHILEINKRLREVEQMITHASKLKTETGADQSVFWKGTLGSFKKIDERLLRLSSKIRELNK